MTTETTVTFEVRPTPHPRTIEERQNALAELSFGKVFTDHMARVAWTPERGWYGHRVEAYGPLSLDPATAVLHYAQEIFEGMKAYRHADGSVWTFRPRANAARFAASARRLALPVLSEEEFIASIQSLVATDVEWVPDSPGSSLYLRPFMFAAEAFLGVRPAQHVEYLVIASPSGPYFTSGFNPVSIWVTTEFHRAGPGGTGAAKCGGNYAASLLPQQLAAEHGCSQVCFLDARTESLLEELGGMNVFFIHDDGSVHTPELSGTILEGVTRSSVLQLLADAGRQIHERPLPFSEVQAQIESGKIVEAFACGTAAVVTPIGQFKGVDLDLTVGDGRAGQTTRDLHTQLTDLQYGHAKDTYGWLYQLA
ncbi:MAG TPA: branched-chain amino acid aminotransferase [Beutenbergiaceae bacterium]|nr:branched-chain amino acid aminotransferase [Beutenbergiaceae bacterium]